MCHGALKSKLSGIIALKGYMSPNNIHEFLERCKLALWAYLEEGIGEWGLIIMVFLVGFGAFGLGRLSALEDVRPPVSIEMAPVLAQPQGMYPGGQYVASRTGSVYYFPWCAEGTISPDKMVWFASEAAAKAAGYLPAKNCKGLQ
jgi:hypothetical protein